MDTPSRAHTKNLIVRGAAHTKNLIVGGCSPNLPSFFGGEGGGVWVWGGGRGPHSEDSNIKGSMLGSRCVCQLPLHNR